MPVGPVHLAAAAVPIVILCGGLGTRLRDAGENVPKPLIDIGGRPMIWHIMMSYAAHGFRRFVLPLGYGSRDFKEYFLRYREHVDDFTVRLGAGDRQPQFHTDLGCQDWEVTLVDTGLHTGTAARLARVRSHLEDTEVFGVTYGDGLTDVDITAELEFHRDHGEIGTLLGVRPESRYGELVLEGRVVAAFDEKPTIEGSYVNAGYFFFRNEFLDYVSDDNSMLESSLTKLAESRDLRMFPHEGFWVGMDTYREYSLLNALWDRDEAPWASWKN